VVRNLLGHKRFDGIGELLEGEGGGPAGWLLPSNKVESGRILTVRWVMDDKENMVLEPRDRSNY
jgi:hypothetical protein